VDLEEAEALLRLRSEPVSDEPFERLVARKLARVSGLWVHHPDDAPGGRKAPRPADFIFGHRLGWGLLEVKHCAGASLPAAQWPPSQRRTAARVTAAGGSYFLLVRFEGRCDRLWRFPAPPPLHWNSPPFLPPLDLDKLSLALLT